MSPWRVVRFVAKVGLLLVTFAVAYKRQDMWFVALLVGFMTGTVFGAWATLEAPEETE